jgi:hypothetical protein
VESEVRRVPRISEFYGIIIFMYYRDHAPPHFHAIYAGEEVLIAIASVRVLGGSLPKRAMGLVRDWARSHRVDLLANWDLARQGRPLNQIPALQ